MRPHVEEAFQMKSMILRWLSMPMALLVLSISLTACNTLEGVGEDVQAGGQAVEKTAEDAKN
jgi:entericidin B